jgi:hypothetical protein
VIVLTNSVQEKCPMSTPFDATLPTHPSRCSAPNQYDTPRLSPTPHTHSSRPIPEQSDDSLPRCSAQERIVQFLLSCGANVNIRNARGQTPLHIAAQQGHVGIVRLLLSSKHIDVNAQDRCRATPLYLASENGHVMVVKLLVEHNAQLDIRAVSM